MIPLNDAVTYLDDSFRQQIKPTALEFLRQLNGLTVFDIKGIDSSRTRVVTTLIHGNEPSGFIASHLWLRSESTPQTNLRIIICNPETAQAKPIFTNRYVGSNGDLNRFFGSKDLNSAVALRAQKITDAVKDVSPESVLDLHNTSGASPAFAVAVSDDKKTKNLVSLFTEKLIFTGLHVGAIMEQDFDCPIATIECGGASEVYSHQVATDGLHRYFTKEYLYDANSTRVKVHRHPIRIELRDDASVGFSHHRLPTTDITLRADIEELNRQHTEKGEFLGWYSEEHQNSLQAIDESGNDRIDELFEFNNGCIFVRQNLQFFMVTTVPEIATNDCLFYLTIE